MRLQDKLVAVPCCLPPEADLFRALLLRADLDQVVPSVIERLERDPLASAGYFHGDLLRALIELPADFWRKRVELFSRYQTVVRAGAVARRSLPATERLEFWTDVNAWRGVDEVSSPM